MDTMPTSEAYWTVERMARLRALLARHTDDVFAQSLLRRLSATQSSEEERHLVAESLPTLMNQEEFITLWEGREITTRLALRDILLSYLRDERVIQNVPTGEPASPDEDAERERLADLFGQGERVSDTIVEDRG